MQDLKIAIDEDNSANFEKLLDKHSWIETIDEHEEKEEDAKFLVGDYTGEILIKRTLLAYAIEKNKINCIKLLLKKNFDLSKGSWIKESIDRIYDPRPDEIHSRMVHISDEIRSEKSCFEIISEKNDHDINQLILDYVCEKNIESDEAKLFIKRNFSKLKLLNFIDLALHNHLLNGLSEEEKEQLKIIFSKEKNSNELDSSSSTSTNKQIPQRQYSKRKAEEVIGASDTPDREKKIPKTEQRSSSFPLSNSPANIMATQGLNSRKKLNESLEDTQEKSSQPRNTEQDTQNKSFSPSSSNS